MIARPLPILNAYRRRSDTLSLLTDVDATPSAAAEDADLSGEVGNITQTCLNETYEVGVFFDGTLR